jgi:internalin A
MHHALTTQHTTHRHALQVPDSLGLRLVSLKSLHLPNNDLVGLPDSIGRLTGLTELNLLRNKLATLPSVSKHPRRLRCSALLVYPSGS